VALKQVRELVSDMKFISLASEIEHSRKLLHTAGIALTVVEKEKLPLLSSVEETMLALSVREAITNIIKHSQAKQCSIRMETGENYFCVTIIDDGVGLVKKEGGNGIQSMRERMEALHGSLLIHPSPGQGTAVSLKLPIRQQGKEGRT
jgi:two-component system sensor histidine kinase DesK